MSWGTVGRTQAESWSKRPGNITQGVLTMLFAVMGIQKTSAPAELMFLKILFVFLSDIGSPSL